MKANEKVCRLGIIRQSVPYFLLVPMKYYGHTCKQPEVINWKQKFHFLFWTRCSAYSKLEPKTLTRCTLHWRGCVATPKFLVITGRLKRYVSLQVREHNISCRDEGKSYLCTVSEAHTTKSWHTNSHWILVFIRKCLNIKRYIFCKK